MPGRQYAAENGYRYGFNGKENDNEVKGEGNQQDYGMRIYDPRVGKFLSVDPLAHSFPWYTPYQFAGNKPIWAVDLDGLEENTSSTYVHRPDPALYQSRSVKTENDILDLSVFNLHKLPYKNTAWTGNPFEASKIQVFANNTAVSAWNQGVNSAAFSYNYLTSKKYRKKTEISFSKKIIEGILWLSKSKEEKWDDVKEYASDVNNWEDFAGSLLLGKVTTSFSSFKAFGKSPITVAGGISLDDIGRVGRRLLGLKDRTLNDMQIRVFGSVVKGASNPNDLDILIITNNRDLFSPGSRLDKILESIKTDFQNSTGKPLDINIMSPEMFKRAKGGAFKADVDQNSIKL